MDLKASTVQPPALDEDDEITLGDIIGVLRKRKLGMTLAALIGLGLGTAYFIYAPPWFRAEVLLKPSEQKNSGSSSSDAAGALASLTGINLNSGNMTAEPMAILTSREFLGKFITDHNLMPVLFKKRWDAQTNSWKKSRIFPPPDLRDAEGYFKTQMVEVQENKKTGLVTLTLDWKDPNAAADWANELVQRVNDRMRQRAIKESEYNVHFLEQELAAANIVPLQQSIGRVLEDELQKLMLAKGNLEYSFRVVDPAQPPRHPIGLPRPMYILLGLVIGLALYVTAVVTRYILARSARD
jgi:uncharacterized protein involved in exopolysaccharide biosynthesis